MALTVSMFLLVERKCYLTNYFFLTCCPGGAAQLSPNNTIAKPGADCPASTTTPIISAHFGPDLLAISDAKHPNLRKIMMATGMPGSGMTLVSQRK